MNKIALLGIAVGAVLVMGMLAMNSNLLIAKAQYGEGSGEPSNGIERVSVTIGLSKIKLKPGEVIVLLDTTHAGSLIGMHATANLPCNEGNGPKSGNNTPDVKIVAGVAGGVLGDVIESASDHTGFAGPEKTCVFHDTIEVGVEVPVITDVIIVNAGDSDVDLLEGATVTLTGTYL